MRASFPVSLLLSCSSAVLAQAPAFAPSRLFGDHMVLPPARRVPVHGHGTAGQTVRVRASWGSTAETQVGADGCWRCELETPPRGANGQIVFASGDVEHTARDVLVGDVWLASGQSNMEMPVAAQAGWSGVRDWQQEVLAADWAQLRVFTVAKRAADQPVDDVEGSWQVVSPATVGDVSATAYFFARELLRRGKGPIGLVVSSWGGTIAEAWTSERGLAGFPDLAATIARRRTRSGDDEATRRAAFWRAVDAAAPAEGTPGRDVVLPERWSAGELAGFDGVVDYRRTLELPPAFVGRELVLEFGPIDDMDTVFWNGERVAGSERDGVWHVPRRYVVGKERTAAARIDLRVRVVDTGGEGGYGGDADGMRLSLPGGAALPLGGTWHRIVTKPLAELPQWPRSADGPNRPAVLWNGMIAPLLPFAFTGVIWYQGEGNRGNPDRYAVLFPNLIADWRRALRDEVPFYFVQIAPFGYDDDEGDRTARLRAAQAAALALPHTGMVVTLDCGDARDIHPAHKQPVGERLALLALAGHYQEQVVAAGPLCVSAVRDASAVRLRFAPGHGGLALANGGAGFEVAGRDGAFVAVAAAVDGDEVRLDCARVPSPQRVRYAWRAVPEWSLRGGTGLPAPPFELTIE